MGPSKNKKRLFSFLLPLVVVSIILGYFQLFYRSTPVKNNLAKNSLVLQHDAQVRSVHFSPNDSFIASGSVDRTVKIWNARTGQLVKTLQHPEGITYLDYSPDGKMLVTSSYDGFVRCWDILSGKVISEFNSKTGVIWSVAVSPDGKLIAAAGEGKDIFVWDHVSRQLIARMKGHDRNIWSVRFTPDGQNIISSSFDNTVKMWNAGDGRLVNTIEKHTEAVVDVAVAHNGKLLASTGDDKKIMIWRLPDVKMIHRISVPEHIQAADFSPDDKLLLVGGRDKPMIGEFLQEIFGDSHFNPGISFRLIDVQSGNVIQTFTDHFNDVNDVAWSHGGEFFATASEDNTVRIYKMLAKAQQSFKSKESSSVEGFPIVCVANALAF